MSTTTDLLMFWNLYEAGIERLDGRDERWRAQCALVAAHRPRVLMTTEGWGWHLDDRAFFEDAKAAFGMEGELFTAKTGCHQAVFWQPDIEHLGTERQPHELAHWHGHGLVTLRLPGRSTPLRFLVAHLDPFSPTGRRVESDHLRRYADPSLPPLVLAMDANCVPPGDPEPDWSRTPRHRRDDHLLDAEGAPTGRRCGGCSATTRTTRCSWTRAPGAGTARQRSAGCCRRATRSAVSTCSCSPRPWPGDLAGVPDPRPPAPAPARHPPHRSGRPARRPRRPPCAARRPARRLRPPPRHHPAPPPVTRRTSSPKGRPQDVSDLDTVKRRLSSGEPYSATDPALAPHRARCMELLDKFNSTALGDSRPAR